MQSTTIAINKKQNNCWIDQHKCVDKGCKKCQQTRSWCGQLISRQLHSQCQNDCSAWLQTKLLLIYVTFTSFISVSANLSPLLELCSQITSSVYAATTIEILVIVIVLLKCWQQYTGNYVTITSYSFSYCLIPLMGRGVNWLHLAIQV